MVQDFIFSWGKACKVYEPGLSCWMLVLRVGVKSGVDDISQI